MKIGFISGTAHLSEAQNRKLFFFLKAIRFAEFHYGGMTLADVEARKLVERCFPHARIHTYIVDSTLGKRQVAIEIVRAVDCLILASTPDLQVGWSYEVAKYASANGKSSCVL